MSEGKACPPRPANRDLEISKQSANPYCRAEQTHASGSETLDLTGVSVYNPTQLFNMCQGIIVDLTKNPTCHSTVFIDYPAACIQRAAHKLEDETHKPEVLRHIQVMSARPKRSGSGNTVRRWFSTLVQNQNGRMGFNQSILSKCIKKSNCHKLLTFKRRSNTGGASSSTFIFTDTAALHS